MPDKPTVPPDPAKPKPVLFLFDPKTSTAAEMLTEIKLGVIKSGLTAEEKVAVERLIGEHGKKYVVENWTALESQIRSL